MRSKCLPCRCLLSLSLYLLLSLPPFSLLPRSLLPPLSLPPFLSLPRFSLHSLWVFVYERRAQRRPAGVCLTSTISISVRMYICIYMCDFVCEWVLHCVEGGATYFCVSRQRLCVEPNSRCVVFCMIGDYFRSYFIVCIYAWRFLLVRVLVWGRIWHGYTFQQTHALYLVERIILDIKWWKPLKKRKKKEKTALNNINY